MLTLTLIAFILSAVLTVVLAVGNTWHGRSVVDFLLSLAVTILLVVVLFV